MPTILKSIFVLALVGKTILLPSQRRVIGRARSLSYSPDGTQLATGTDENVYIWDATGTQIALLPVKDRTIALSFSPNGTKLATASRKDLYIWQTATWNLLRKYPLKDIAPSTEFEPFLWGPPKDYQSLAYSPDGTHIAVAFKYGNLFILDAGTGNVVKKLFEGDKVCTASSLSYSRDGRLAAGLGDKIYIWDTATGNILKKFTVEDQVDSVAYSPDGKDLAAGTKKGVFIFGNDTAITLPTRNVDPVSIAYSPNGGELAV